MEGARLDVEYKGLGGEALWLIFVTSCHINMLGI